MSVIDGRIDHCRYIVLHAQKISVPEITVKQRGSLGIFGNKTVDLFFHSAEQIDDLFIFISVLLRKFKLEFQPVHNKKFFPGTHQRQILLRRRADVIIFVESIMFRRMAMKLCELFPELFKKMRAAI